MSNKFEESRPGHEVHEIHRPSGHGYMDQKAHKGMRSPIVPSVPNVEFGVAPGSTGAGAPGTPSVADNTGKSSGSQY